MVFDCIERINTDPKRYSEPAFRYLNNSARPAASKVRDLIEDWFTRYPNLADEPSKERSGWLGDFKSNSSTHFHSSFFELYLHELMIRLGFKVKVHPETDTEKRGRPDFHVVFPSGNDLYLEATLAANISPEEEAAEARVNLVYDTISKLESRDFFLWVKVRGAPDTSPSGAKWRNELDIWIKTLQWDELYPKMKEKGLRAMPSREFSHND